MLSDPLGLIFLILYAFYCPIPRTGIDTALKEIEESANELGANTVVGVIDYIQL